jgi:thiamine-phosphate pyrophosphorylase
VLNLARRRLYLCVSARDDLADFLPAVLRGGVDLVQLREKERPDDARIAAAAVMRPICAQFGVPFIVNDSAELALAVGADGVHVGQDDAPVSHCRDVLGPEAIVGLSTHADDEFSVGLTQDATYFSAGPVAPTPTKPGRAETGVEYAARSQARSDRPVFVTGGVTATAIAGLVAAGLRHFVVVRALTESPDPEAAARDLRRAIDEALA